MIKLNKMVQKKLYESNMRYIRVLHSLHGQFSGCHFLICGLKELTSSNSFNILGTRFHILGPKLDRLSDP